MNKPCAGLAVDSSSRKSQKWTAKGGTP